MKYTIKNTDGETLHRVKIDKVRGEEPRNTLGRAALARGRRLVTARRPSEMARACAPTRFDSCVVRSTSSFEGVAARLSQIMRQGDVTFRSMRSAR